MKLWRLDPLEPDPDELLEIAAALAAGGVIALPTETFYGLAADVRVPEAVRGVARIKNREPGSPLLLLVDGVDAARRLAPDAPPELEEIARRFWPGPLTLVLPAAAGLPAEVISTTGSVAVRHCAHRVTERVIRLLGAPVTGTSANHRGQPPATEAAAVEADLRAEVSGIADAGATPGGLPSTLLDLTGRPFRILRQGVTGREALRRALGERLL